MGFPNEEFHSGILKVGRGVDFGGLDMFFAVTFTNIIKREEKRGFSYVNKSEADRIINCLNHLKENKFNLDDVTIITPYKAQRNYIMELCETNEIKVHISSIDGFQGKEQKIIIISCVRSNP